MAETDRILISKIRDAVDVIKTCLEDGYIDLGAHDELEIGVLCSAIALWENIVLKPRERNRGIK